MRKHCKRRALKSVNPVLLAVCAAKWERDAVTAQIHALIGGDPDKLASSAGRVIYVVLGASILDGLDAELPDLRILRGAAGALYDLAGAHSVSDHLRGALISGLEACARLCEVLTSKHLAGAACDLEFALKAGHLNWSAFEQMGIAA